MSAIEEIPTSEEILTFVTDRKTELKNQVYTSLKQKIQTCMERLETNNFSFPLNGDLKILLDEPVITQEVTNELKDRGCILKMEDRSIKDARTDEEIIQTFGILIYETED